MVKKFLMLGLVGLVMLASQGFAADFDKSLKFSWDQAASDLPSLKEWGLYVMNSSGGTKTAPVVIQYTSGTGPFVASQSFTVTGLPGTKVRKYFVLDAVSKNLARSGFSNEVFYDFDIPFSDVTIPMSLTVTAVINP